MPAPVKVSDELLALAKAEGRVTQRSATAQIEHWASLGRVVEALVAYQDVLALKRMGQALPIPAVVRREDVHNLLWRLIENTDRTEVRAHLRAPGLPLYTVDPKYPDLIVEVRPDGTRTLGRLEGRRFIPAEGESPTRP